MGLLSFVGDLIGGSSKRKAISSAEQAQLAAQQQASDLQQQAIQGQASQYNDTINRLNPYQSAGTTSLAGIENLLGLGGPEGQQSALDSLKNSPLFSSIFNTGKDAILANASATGGLRGGNVQDALSRFGGDTFSQLIQNQLSNLSGLMNTGYNAVNAGGQFGAAAQGAEGQGLTNQGNLALQGGQTQAGGILGRNAVSQQMLQSGLNFANQVGSAFIPGAGQLAGLTGSGGGGGIMSQLAGLF